MAIGWAIVGCGDIAYKRVAPAIVQHPGSEMTAFFSNSPERAAEMKDTFGGQRAYTDLPELLADDEVHAVYVASPQDRHCAETVAAANAGKHVLCEKPMAMTAAECREMIGACESNSVQLGVAYYRRWYPKARKMKELIDSGAIGTPVRARILIGGRYDPAIDDWKHWRVTSAAGGGALWDVGSHRLDVLCYLLGEPARVAGLTSNIQMSYAVPDTETLLCEMQSGCHVVCASNWNLPSGHDEMEIHGTEGTLIATPFDGDSLVLMRDAQSAPVELAPKADNVHLPLIASFTERVAGGEPVEFDGTDGMQATRIIDGACRSAKSGQWEMV